MTRLPPMLALAAGLVAGCAGPQTPIPVRGDVEPLVGRWEGEYSSRETGRVGSIVFTLRPGRDTATGDVLMIPSEAQVPSPLPRETETMRRHAQVLHVSFVRCEGQSVTGWIEPYPDPDTGERVYTTFDGVLRADRIEGTFTSELQLSGRRTAGTWKVKRTKVDGAGGGTLR